MRQKHMTDSEPKEIKQDLKCKEEDEKITRSALASRQALRRWGEIRNNSKQGKLWKPKDKSTSRKEKL